MSGELINDRHSSYTPQPLALQHPLKDTGHASPFPVCPYSSTIASCKDFPLPIHSKCVFLEPEQEVNVSLVKESQQKQKESLLKRLTLINIRKQMTTFLTKIRDTLTSLKDKVAEFFGLHQPSKKIEIPQKKRMASSSKIAEKNVAPKTEKSPEALPAPNFNVDDVEKERISEIANTQATYEAELERSGGGNMNALIEMACKIAIMLSSLDYRFTKKEMNDYRKHLEVNVQKKVKTFESARLWTYFKIGFEGAAGLSGILGGVGSLAGNAGSTVVGSIFKGVGQAAEPLRSFSKAAEGMDGIQNEEKGARRTEYDFLIERDKEIRTDMSTQREKTDRVSQHHFETIRNLERELTEAKKRAAQAA